MQNLGITANTTWTLNFSSQLYEVNKANRDQPSVPNMTEGQSTTSAETSVTNKDVNSSTVQESNNVAATTNRTEGSIQESNNIASTTANRTEEILKETTAALKTATEAVSSMSALVTCFFNSENAIVNSQNTSKSHFDLSTATVAIYG